MKNLLSRMAIILGIAVVVATVLWPQPAAAGETAGNVDCAYSCNRFWAWGNYSATVTCQYAGDARGGGGAFYRDDIKVDCGDNAQIGASTVDGVKFCAETGCPVNGPRGSKLTGCGVYEGKTLAPVCKTRVPTVAPRATPETATSGGGVREDARGNTVAPLPED